MASFSVLVYSTTVLILASLAVPALSQVAVDNSYCENYRIFCPGKHNQYYEKYCCLDSSNGYVLYSCCNPYIGWIIGICVGVPSIIILVVFVITTYCCCVRYQNKRMEAAMVSYRRSGRTGGNTSIDFAAPPAYTTLSGDAEEPSGKLPTYTAADPFPSLKPPEDDAEIGQVHEQQQAESDVVASAEHVVEESGSASSQITAEDIPLVEGDNY